MGEEAARVEPFRERLATLRDDEETRADGRTVDAFHCGCFHLVQSRDGHRAGLDALLVAATATDDRPVHYADFGAGSGAIGCAVAARFPKVQVTLIEREHRALADARATLLLSENGHFADRVGILEADLGARGKARAEAGFRPGLFDHVLANPPFDQGNGRASPNPRRAAAHVMPDGLIEDWSRTAAATLKHGGTLTMLLRPASLPKVIEAWTGRFSGPSILPVHTDDGPAMRILVRGRRGTKEPLVIHQPVILSRDGVSTAIGIAIAAGTAILTL